MSTKLNTDLEKTIFLIIDCDKKHVQVTDSKTEVTNKKHELRSFNDPTQENTCVTEKPAKKKFFLFNTNSAGLVEPCHILNAFILSIFYWLF